MMMMPCRAYTRAHGEHGVLAPIVSTPFFITIVRLLVQRRELEQSNWTGWAVVLQSNKLIRLMTGTTNPANVIIHSGRRAIQFES